MKGIVPFWHCFHYVGKDDPAIGEWIITMRGGDNYTSHQIQNDILKIMATEVLLNISTSLQDSPFICLMMDETIDVPNHEQTKIVLRHVSDKMEVLEELIGIYQVPSIDSETLTKVAKDALCRCNLLLSKLRGQYYDGASAMRGAKSGVAKRILAEEPRTLYTHCYGHSINLAACDAIRGTKVMKDAMETAHEITKLIKHLPRREGIFVHRKPQMVTIMVLVCVSSVQRVGQCEPTLWHQLHPIMQFCKKHGQKHWPSHVTQRQKPELMVCRPR